MRDKINLNSSAGTGHYYTTTKNKRTMTEKMEIRKYDPVVRKHAIYKEGKIKQPPGPRGGSAVGFAPGRRSLPPEGPEGCYHRLHRRRAPMARCISGPVIGAVTSLWE